MICREKEMEDRVARLETELQRVQEYLLQMANLIQTNARLASINADNIRELGGLVSELSEASVIVHEALNDGIKDVEAAATENARVISYLVERVNGI